MVESKGRGPFLSGENQDFVPQGGSRRVAKIIDTSICDGDVVVSTLTEENIDESGIPVTRLAGWTGDESSGHPKGEAPAFTKHKIEPPEKMHDVLQDTPKVVY